MAKKKIPEYGTVISNGHVYYRKRLKDTDGKYCSLYGKTPEELYRKECAARLFIKNSVRCRRGPTLKDYCKKWMVLHSGVVEESTMIGYRHIIKKYIMGPLGEKEIASITPDDIKEALLLAKDRSRAIYRTVVTLYKMIFGSAEASGIIDRSPADKIGSKGGVPQKERTALTDEQAERLIETVKDLLPYLFVMIGLYTGLRREEILALKWDSVILDTDNPYITVRRAWRAVHNRPEISDKLKTEAAKRNVPVPKRLFECLIEARKRSFSDYVICNSTGGPLSYTQFERLWAYIRTRTCGTVTYTKYTKYGEKIRRTIVKRLGEKARNSKDVYYTLDFKVTPHQLRHTYITNLIYAGVDPKTVQYLAGHKNSKITMDIYAKAKYNRPEELSGIVNDAFDSMKEKNAGLL